MHSNCTSDQTIPIPIPISLAHSLLVRVVSTLGGVALVGLLTGCISDTVAGVPTPILAGDLMGAAPVWPQAATLAVGDSLQLTVQARTIDGVPITTGVQRRFESSDPLSVTVSSDGRITGVQATPYSTVSIYSFATYKGVTFRDTISVRVNQTARVIDSVSLQPLSGTLTGVVGGTIVLSPRIYAEGTQLLDVAFAIHVNANDGFQKYSNLPFLQPGKKGTFWVGISGVAYGYEFADSVQYTISDIGASSLTLATYAGADQAYGSTTFYIARNGTFTIGNYTAKSVTVTFSDPSAVLEGNITIPSYASGTATLVKAGTITWSTGATTAPSLGGTIGVRD